jgi:hypothetical protein
MALPLELELELELELDRQLVPHLGMGGPAMAKPAQDHPRVSHPPRHTHLHPPSHPQVHPLHPRLQALHQVAAAAVTVAVETVAAAAAVVTQGTRPKLNTTRLCLAFSQMSVGVAGMRTRPCPLPQWRRGDS